MMCMSKYTRKHVDVEVKGQGVQVSSLPGDQLRLQQYLYSQLFNPPEVILLAHVCLHVVHAHIFKNHCNLESDHLTSLFFCFSLSP